MNVGQSFARAAEHIGNGCLAVDRLVETILPEITPANAALQRDVWSVMAVFGVCFALVVPHTIQLDPGESGSILYGSIGGIYAMSTGLSMISALMCQRKIPGAETPSLVTFYPATPVERLAEHIRAGYGAKPT